MYFVSNFPKLNYNFIEHIPGVFGVKNRDGYYVALNQQCVSMFGFKTPEDFIKHGGTDKDLRAPAVELAEQFIAEDQRVFQQKKSLKTLVSGIYADQSITYFYGEKIYLDDEYIAFYHQNITDMKKCNILNIHQLCQIISANSPANTYAQGTFCLEDAYTDISLTKRQTEVMYLLILGKVMREIALILNLSQRTVETHVEMIKSRLKCKTKSELIEYAIENGFLSRVPERLVYDLSATTMS